MKEFSLVWKNSRFERFEKHFGTPLMQKNASYIYELSLRIDSIQDHYCIYT